MKKYTFLLIILSILMASELLAQDRPYRNFGTLELYKKQKKMNKDSVTNQAIFSHQVNKFRRQGEYEPIQLQVIFHVVHKGSDGYVSEDKIWSQIEALNRDFGAPTLTAADVDDQGKHFIDRAVDTELSFCIAEKSNGDAEIEYVETDVEAFNSDDFIKDKNEGGADPSQANKYINIWVGKLVDTLSGYAQYPDGQKKTDGIVIDYRYFGQIDDPDWPYNEGKTLTHLMGNYLGLMDIWGDSQCADDLVHDTPLHNAQNVRCPGYLHLSSCGAYILEMTMNFMDNTDDVCMYMFTQGQKGRMHALLYNGGPRNGLDKNNGSCAEGIDPNSIATRSGNEKADGFEYIKIYPNPTNGDLNIQFDKLEEDINLIVSDVSGKEVFNHKYAKSSSGQVIYLDTDAWTSGIYFFHFSNDQIDRTKRIIVE